jgi:acetyl-CoA carboxylase carboxyl transferase subunit beta
MAASRNPHARPGTLAQRAGAIIDRVSNKHIQVTVDRLKRIAHIPEKGRKPAEAGTCPRCESHYRSEEMERNARVCTACGYHFPIAARARLDHLADGGEWRELWTELRASDPLQFVDLEPYPQRARKAEMSSGLGEAVVVAELEVGGHGCVAAIMDFSFMGGSMGSVVGEKIARACERAIELGVPLVTVTASGGARMQEGVLALMQMAKTVVAFEEMNDAGLPIIVVLAHPTTGGVWASFAALGDVTYAEPGALIAFSGPRVIEQTTREKLPPDFGLAESQLHNGQIDDVVDRRELPERIGRVLRILHRPGLEAGSGFPFQWAQAGGDAVGKVAHGVAHALPKIPKRIADRIGRGGDGDEDGNAR